MQLVIKDLSVSVSGLRVLEDINIHVERGEIVTVVGANGAGKSTLLRTISGLDKPQKGEIRFEDTKVTGMNPKNIAELGISMVPEGKQLFYQMTVLENLRIGAYKNRKNPAVIKDGIDKVFELFPVLKKHQHRIAGTFSGGEQQMLSISRGLMSNPKLLAIDELSLGLAPKIITMLLDTIQLLNKDGMTILLVEQNVNQGLRVAHRGYVIENGNLVLEGTGQELLTNEHVKKAYLGL